MRTKATACCLATALTLLAHTSVAAQGWVPELFERSGGDGNRFTNLLREEMESEIGTDAPRIIFETIDDQITDSLSHLEGHVLLVTFWKTGCSGCRMQRPELSRLQQEYTDQGLKVIFLSPEQIDAQTSYFREHPTNGIKGKLDPQALSRPYQTLATPSAFVVDRAGVVRETWVGPETFAALEKRVLPYLRVTNE